MRKFENGENLVPRLRFPGFEGEWSKKRIGDFYSPISAGKSKRNEGGKGVPFYGSTGVIGFSDSYDYEGNKLLVARVGANAGSLYRVEGRYSVSDNTIIISQTPEQSIDYLYFRLLDFNLNSLVFGSGQPLITGGQLTNLQLAFPSLNEQNKVSTFLLTIDGKILNLKKKKTLLEKYKKGMMQKIFDREVRFKDEDGKDFGEWEEMRLGILSKITTGKLDANAMIANGAYRFYTCAKEFYYIDDYAFDTEALLISGNGANVGYIHHYKGKFNAYQRTYVLDGFKNNITYIKYFLDQHLSKRIDAEKNEGNTPYIVMSTLSEMLVSIPSSEEQTKIANFLSAIDDKINLVAVQVEKMEKFKKGLLGEMFV